MRKFFVVDGEVEYSNPEAAGQGPDESAAADSAIESGLVLLLSEIARHAEEINESGNKNPVEVIGILSDVINRAAEFVAAAGIEKTENRVLAEAVSISSTAVSEAGLLHVDNGRLSAQTVINLYKGWSGPKNEKSLVFNRIAMSMVGILEFLFGSIAPAFSSEKIADEWSDAFAICSGELSYAVKNVKF
jgi:hypothetical protein